MEPKYYNDMVVQMNVDGYIIGSKVGVDNNTYSFAPHQARHATYKEALAEAERLAKFHHGKTFVVFRPVSEHVTHDVISRPIRLPE